QGEKVILKSRRGQTETVAWVGEDVAPGVMYMAMHFAEGVNNLTNTALDPLSKMPELKHCAVSIAKIAGGK
ncbi:MAG: formate dehydrogenase subunit alpha, partial [Methanospirillum sp.]|uniref:molybdopterin dinucleotide binding domain-containing protein n=1 Tax=Methanospirillum sp. TaxID=45200 RepID=UPI002374AB28